MLLYCNGFQTPANQSKFCGGQSQSQSLSAVRQSKVLDQTSCAPSVTKKKDRRRVVKDLSTSKRRGGGTLAVCVAWVGKANSPEQKAKDNIISKTRLRLTRLKTA